MVRQFRPLAQFLYVLLWIMGGTPSLPAAEVVWTSWFTPVQAFDLESRTVRQVAPDQLATSVIADPSNSALYYTRYRGIFRTDVSGNHPTTLVETVPPVDYDGTGPYYGEIGSPWGIAVDERSGDLYWGEALYNPGSQWDERSIRRLNAANGQVEEILKLTDGTFPRDLVLDQSHQLLYFGTHPSQLDPQHPRTGAVHRLSLVDGHVERLYDTSSTAGSGADNIAPVRGLAIAPEKDLVFWNEDAAHIMAGSLDGTATPRVVLGRGAFRCGQLESLFYHPLEDKLYYGTGCELGRVNPDGSDQEILLSGAPVSGLVGITLFDPQLAIVPEPTTPALVWLALIAALGRTTRRR